MRFSILPCMAAVSLSSLACAQSMNIDVGNASPTPSSAFGAAAGQVGVWNTYAGGTLNNLVNLSGAATTVSMTGTAGGFLGGYNDPATFGDDEALMDDSLIIPFLETYTVSGLAAGMYDVYTYAWTLNGLPTDLNVNGQGFQTVGGAWPGGYVVGITHSLHTVVLGSTQNLVIDVHTVNGALGGFSGLQIVAVPGPSAAAMLLGGVGALLGRRRRR